MSRTYHHGDKAKLHYLDGLPWGESRWWYEDYDAPKRKRSNCRWLWMGHTPGWWVREMMTRPQRAKTRQLLHATMMLDDLEDAPLFPHPKRPHIYYW